jgi:hypothetical protein
MFLWSQTAFAGLTLTLTPSAQPAASGAEVLFNGRLRNTSATERLFLNDVAFTPDPPAVTTVSGNAIFANVPGILLPGEKYEGPLFRIALSNASYLTFSYVPGAPDVTCRVEFSTNLLEWGTVDVESVIIANPTPPGRLTVRYRQPVTSSRQAFLRLKVTR